MSAMKQPTITCPECHGRAVVPLPPHLAETLAMIPSRGAATAHDLAKKHEGVTSNALSNRLMELLDLKLVTRERAGKFWRYSRA